MAKDNSTGAPAALLLTPVFRDVVVMIEMMGRYHSRCGRSIGSKIEIFADGCDRPAVDRRAVTKISGTADRSRLRECEGASHGERGRQNGCFYFHVRFPSQVPPRFAHHTLAFRSAADIPAAAVLAKDLVSIRRHRNRVL